MKPIIRALLLLFAFMLPAAADEAPPIPEEPSPAAMDFVAQFSDNHLSAMLSRIGARQSAMVALSQVHGEMLAAVFDVHINEAVAKHGPAWHRNMARAWTGLLTDDEMTSLREDGAASPHAAKYQSLSGAAGQRMQTISQDLFREVLSEVIGDTIEDLASTPEEATGTSNEAPVTDKDATGTTE